MGRSGRLHLGQLSGGAGDCAGPVTDLQPLTWPPPGVLHPPDSVPRHGPRPPRTLPSPFPGLQAETTCERRECEPVAVADARWEGLGRAGGTRAWTQE